METFDHHDEWLAAFQKTWLSHLKATGKKNWDLYQYPRNTTQVTGTGLDLAQSRLLLISTAGGFLPNTQQPFDTIDPLGDYSLRLIPSTAPLHDLAFAHGAYDHEAVDADPQVLVPLRHLEAMVSEGLVGSLTEHMISFCGYQPDAARVADELAPRIVTIAHQEQAQGALLVPA